MTFSERHVSMRWTIVEKPEGGFVAKFDNPEETIEGATREEVEAKLRDKVSAKIGVNIAAKLDLHKSGTHVEKKITFSWKKGQAENATDELGSGTPAPIDAGSGSLLSSVWKLVVLVGVVVIIWLLLRH